MEDALAENGVEVAFAAETAEEVHVAYRSHQSDPLTLIEELRIVLQTVLEERPGTPVRGAVVFTQRPVILQWHVEASWAQAWARDERSTDSLVLPVVHTLESVQFG